MLQLYRMQVMLQLQKATCFGEKGSADTVQHMQRRKDPRQRCPSPAAGISARSLRSQALREPRRPSTPVLCW